METKPLIIILACAVCAACATALPLKTQLEIREFQTRSYETTDIKMVMKAVMNVLQDEGYIIKSGDLELGLLSAVKELDIEDKREVFWKALWIGSDARWKKNSIVEATANISEFGDQCRVRLNFQAKKFDNRGAVIDIKQIEGEVFYQDFFAKIDKGIFIQKEKI